MVQPLGVHYLLELRGCDPTVINDLPEVRRILIEAAKQAKATVLDARFHQFSPQGVSGVVVVGESHLSIHTWPEYGYASADIYTCGHTDPLRAAIYIAESLGAKSAFFTVIDRGEHFGIIEPGSKRIPVLPSHWVSRFHSEWFFMDYANSSMAALLRLKGVVFSSRSPYQQIEILETEDFGRCLILDGRIQSAEADEFVYHEALVHPAMITHPDPREVLILGGGEGATLREVLRHRTVEKAVMVDIDEQVVQACRRFLPEWSDGAFDDPRTHLIIADAVQYLRKTDERFDVVIADITDPEPGTLSELLISQETFETIKQRLKPGGVLVNQAGSTGITELGLFASIYRTMSNVFRYCAPYSIQITSLTQPWGFIIASGTYDPRSLTPEEVEVRLSLRCMREKLRYYDGAVHQAMFTLPRCLWQLLEVPSQFLSGKTQEQEKGKTGSMK
ncbi:MAG: polyamine aminopropyltransferase [Candidatus Methanomethylicaceae archaeon]